MIHRRLLGVALTPARLVVASFVAWITLGTLLLRLPFAIDDGLEHPGWVDALFWATSASTVTGLGTSPVESFSLFGELVLLALIQFGGFGIMTIGSVLALVAFRRIGIRQRLLAQTEIGAIEMGELRSLIGSIAKITLAVEAGVAAIVFVRLLTIGEMGAGRAAYWAVFHAISAFNNAGIALTSDSLNAFVGDPWVVFPISGAFVLGGLGFPVLVELRRRLPRRRMSLHARITIAGTLALLVVGPAMVLIVEWTNPATLGQMDVWDKLQAAWFQGVTPRTAGFSTVDIGALREPTLGAITVLMFVGAGPASTAGGIKVTTTAILFVATWSELRGHADVNVFQRRLPVSAVRLALTITVLSGGAVFATAVALTALSPFHLTDTLFESASAFGTVGLSTGITAGLPTAGHLVLVVMMLAGRVGPVTFVSALALRQRPRSYRYAEERPIIG